MGTSQPTRPPGETRRLVAELREQGLSYSQIAERINARKSTVAYHARRLGIPVNETFARRYDWTQIQAAYDEGRSVRECAALFGFSLASWHKAVNRGAVVAKPQKMDIELLLVEGRMETARGHLKRRLLGAGLKEDRCEMCGITHWRGVKLSQQLHHVNGDRTDNRIENLQLLCPNCHSLTDTYSGRNRHRRRKAA